MTDIHDVWRILGWRQPDFEIDDLHDSIKKAVVDGFNASMALTNCLKAFLANPEASTFAALKPAYERFMAAMVSDRPDMAALLEKAFAPAECVELFAACKPWWDADKIPPHFDHPMSENSWPWANSPLASCFNNKLN